MLQRVLAMGAALCGVVIQVRDLTRHRSRFRHHAFKLPGLKKSLPWDWELGGVVAHLASE